MTLSEQCGILMEAIKEELLQPEDIIRWADGIIVAMDKPPTWIIELSTLDSPYLVDFAAWLRDQVTAPLPIRRQIQVIVLAHDAGLLSLSATLQKLFRLTILEGLCERTHRGWIACLQKLFGRTKLERVRRPMDALGTRLQGLLVEWDRQEDLDVIESPLLTELEALFRDYLIDAEDIKAVLPWKFQKTA